MKLLAVLAWCYPFIPLAEASAPEGVRDFIPYTAGGAILLAFWWLLTKHSPALLKTNSEQAAAFLKQLNDIQTAHKEESSEISKAIHDLAASIQSNTVAVQDCKVAQRQLAELAAAQPRVQT